MSTRHCARKSDSHLLKRNRPSNQEREAGVRRPSLSFCQAWLFIFSDGTWVRVCSTIVFIILSFFLFCLFVLLSVLFLVLCLFIVVLFLSVLFFLFILTGTYGYLHGYLQGYLHPYLRVLTRVVLIVLHSKATYSNSVIITMLIILLGIPIQ